MYKNGDENDLQLIIGVTKTLSSANVCARGIISPCHEDAVYVQNHEKI